jgi:NAD(P)-dependent dehydrogenase (short-subunit alcohol dehydrogenase family)
MFVQKALAETARNNLGRIEILFANAGITDMLPLARWDESAFDRSFGVNLKGPRFLIQVLLPLMEQTPVRRFGSRREVAHAVVLFASDESAFHRGQITGNQWRHRQPLGNRRPWQPPAED